MTKPTSDLLSAARGVASEVVALRRELHANPELGLQLPRTQQLILESLTGLGLDVTLGEQLTTIKHAVTHHDITLDCYAAECDGYTKNGSTQNGHPQLRWVRPSELNELPLNVTARRLADLITTA